MHLKNLLLAAVLSASSMASAELLLWQVDNSSVKDSTTEEKISYSTASLMATSYGDIVNGATAVQSYIGNLDGTSEKIPNLAFDVYAAGGDITDRTSQFFFIELFDANGRSVGHSDIRSYGELNQDHYVQSAADFMNNFTGMNAAWKPTVWTLTAVPEPTSGLLLLMGAAFLGLRRKKAV